MGDPRPIGLFDSGVGGLTVLRAIRDLMPGEATVYVADLLHFPYGSRPQEEVRGFAFDLIDYLNGRDVKLVVIACNTATAAALSAARERFEVPIVGVISAGAQAAVEASVTRSIGVISTAGTLRSQAYLHAIKEIDPMIRVIQKACPDLVEIVESGAADSAEAERALQRDLEGIVAFGADTLVLGCTHYPLLEPALQRVWPGRFHVVDSAGTTAVMVRQRLEHAGMLAGSGSRTNHELLVTGAAEQFSQIATNLFGEGLSAVQEVRIWP
ncbi:MAG: glutamate racemase [Candidatus Dormibacteraceae bacterium]